MSSGTWEGADRCPICLSQLGKGQRIWGNRSRLFKKGTDACQPGEATAQSNRGRQLLPGLHSSSFREDLVGGGWAAVGGRLSGASAGGPDMEEKLHRAEALGLRAKKQQSNNTHNNDTNKGGREDEKDNNNAIAIPRG